MRVCLVGGVSSSWTVLNAFIEAGVEVSAVAGVDESRAEKVSDYKSLRELATGAGIPFRSFMKIKEPETIEFLKSHPAELLWVIGLSQLVPEEIVSNFPQGGVGFHPSLLPEGRGRAPVAWTILNQARAAVNLFYLVDAADAGDIIVQREVEVLPEDYSEDLIARTNRVLHECVMELSPRLKGEGPLPATPQDHSKATFYEKRTPADGLIDWGQSADDIHRLIRAAGRPYPGAFTQCGDSQVTIWRAKPVAGDAGDAPAGKVVDASDDPVIVTGDGLLRLTEVELRDGTPVKWSVGMQLGSGS